MFDIPEQPNQRRYNLVFALKHFGLGVLAVVFKCEALSVRIFDWVGFPVGKFLPQHYPVLPLHGYLWYSALDVGVFALSVILFLVALAVFGRLEGNFAEEL